MRAHRTRWMIVALVVMLVGGCGKHATKKAANRQAKNKASRSEEKVVSHRQEADSDRTFAAKEAPATRDAPDDSGLARHEPAKRAEAEPRVSRVKGFQAGTLTAGSIDDHASFSDYRRYLSENTTRGGRGVLAAYSIDNRVVIRVENQEGQPVGDARVVVRDAASQKRSPLLQTTTGSDGQTTFLPGLDARGVQVSLILDVTLPDGSGRISRKVSVSQSPWTVQLQGAVSQRPTKLDLSLVIDATGSMSDELEYLKVEIDSIAAEVKRRFPNVDQRYSLIVYRDEGDEYVVRTHDFTGSLSEFRTTLADQSAGGGGDYPEAMHAALEAAEKLGWRKRDTARVMFLVADAPSHEKHGGRTLKALKRLRADGVTIFPVAASGVRDRAEYVLRAAAFMTGGQYLFLTDDSGVGNPHAEPDVPGYNVDRLDRLMIRMIASELADEGAEIAQTSFTPASRVTYESHLAWTPPSIMQVFNSWAFRIIATALLVGLLYRSSSPSKHPARS